ARRVPGPREGQVEIVLGDRAEGRVSGALIAADVRHAGPHDVVVEGIRRPARAVARAEAVQELRDHPAIDGVAGTVVRVLHALDDLRLAPESVVPSRLELLVIAETA